jgi:hypothetical protein
MLRFAPFRAGGSRDRDLPSVAVGTTRWPLFMPMSLRKTGDDGYVLAAAGPAFAEPDQ